VENDIEPISPPRKNGTKTGGRGEKKNTGTKGGEENVMKKKGWGVRGSLQTSKKKKQEKN